MSWNELVERGGIYFKLVRLQLEHNHLMDELEEKMKIGLRVMLEVMSVNRGR